MIVGNMYCVIYLIFFVFYVFPLYLDYFVSFPEYSLQERYLGFTLSYKDTATRVIYDIFILFVQFVLTKKIRVFGRLDRRDNFNKQDVGKKNEINWFLAIGMFFPILLTFVFSVDKKILYTFGWRELEIFATTSATNTIENFSYFGVMCTLLLLFKHLNSKKRQLLSLLLYLPLLYANMCVQGKRSILFFAIMLLVVLQIPGINTSEKNDIKASKRKLLLLAVISFLCIGLMIFVTVYVKVNIRGWDPSDTLDMYTMTRIDFLKDDRVRFAIYALLHPENQILPSWGLTIFPIVTWFWPLNSILAGHGIIYDSYQVYFSDALQYVVDKPFMTTSFFAELISNFSCLGVLFMCFLCVWVSKVAQNNKYPFRAIVIISFIALQMYTTTYLAVFFEMSIFYMVLYNIINRSSGNGGK